MKIKDLHGNGRNTENLRDLKSRRAAQKVRGIQSR